jgi:hypothetical protein
MYVAAKEVLKFRFLMKTCGTRGPWGRDEKVGLKKWVGLPIKKTCGNSTRENNNKKKNKKRKGISVVYGFSNVFPVKWINCLIIFSSFIYLY